MDVFRRALVVFRIDRVLRASCRLWILLYVAVLISTATPVAALQPNQTREDQGTGRDYAECRSQCLQSHSNICTGSPNNTRSACEALNLQSCREACGMAGSYGYGSPIPKRCSFNARLDCIFTDVWRRACDASTFGALGQCSNVRDKVRNQTNCGNCK